MFGFGKKIKLQEDQYSMVKGISEKLGISKEEVHFLFLEFGQMLLINIMADETKTAVNDIDRKMGYLPEYQNWKKIANMTYECWKRGGEILKEEQ